MINPETKMFEQLKSDNEKLRNQLAWYKSFFDNATDGLFVIQPESWVVLDANDYAAALLGTDKEELIGISIPQFRRIYKLLKKSSSKIILSELNIITPNDEEIMLEVSARFFRFKNQVLIQAIGRDISEQHQLTDKLVQADKLVLLGQLSAGVAHEIRNPLAAVTLNLQVLKRNLNPDNPLYNYVDTALQGAERITRIVEVTLNFSKAAPLDIKTIDLNALITISLDLAITSFKRKDIKVDLKLDDNLPKVSADEKQIQQVLINLLTNAADAIQNEGKVKIKTYIEESDNNNSKYTVVEVADNGIGISPEDLPKIFNPFFTRKHDGTGLGLPITQRILHQHNGKIEVESTLGKGTTFYVKLPIVENNIDEQIER